MPSRKKQKLKFRSGKSKSLDAFEEKVKGWIPLRKKKQLTFRGGKSESLDSAAEKTKT